MSIKNLILLPYHLCKSLYEARGLIKVLVRICFSREKVRITNI